MAKIKAGILSKVSGKVAGVVGGTWKGTNYLRELVKPANPNTPLQQAQRGKMAFVVAVARQLVGDVLNPYLNKFCKTMSGYNWFCKENIKRLAGTPLKFSSAPVLSFGTLQSGAVLSTGADADYGISFSAIPSVPAGHALKLVVAAISEDGVKVGVAQYENPQISTNYGTAITDLGFSSGMKGYTVAFFAEYDANGVLQALSSSVSSPLWSLT